MPETLVVATHNSHKTEEIRELVGSFFDHVVDLTDYPEIPPADETGTTFEENSEIKAMEASSILPDIFVLADDSGLEVDALEKRPGVYSARFAGDNASDVENREKLIGELAKLKEGKARTGRFRCVITLVRGGEIFGVFDGICEGRIAEEERGKGGFGYDPIFIPDGYGETFGQLDASVKNRISHRARAMAKLVDWLGENFS